MVDVTCGVAGGEAADPKDLEATRRRPGETKGGVRVEEGGGVSGGEVCVKGIVVKRLVVEEHDGVEELTEQRKDSFRIINYWQKALRSLKLQQSTLISRKPSQPRARKDCRMSEVLVDSIKLQKESQ